MLSCNSKSNLVGTWEAVSSLDMDSGEISTAEDGEESLIIEIRSDSLKYDGDFYAWELRNDTMIIHEFYVDCILIKEVTPTTLVFEFDFMYVGQVTCKKIK